MYGPPQLISVKRARPLDPKSWSTGSVRFSSRERATTRYSYVRPPATRTRTSSPTVTDANEANRPSPWVLLSTCPTITTAPAASPGAEPKRYQPPRRTSAGISNEPSGFTPTGSTETPSPTDGMTTSRGRGELTGPTCTGRYTGTGGADADGPV